MLRRIKVANNFIVKARNFQTDSFKFKYPPGDIWAMQETFLFFMTAGGAGQGGLLAR